MYGDAVQVVLGEGEPSLLRVILEVEGFQVVGHARGDAELRRVLDVTHPSVIVLDAGISVPAAIDARTRSLGARLVVIWPDAVRTGVADERVDPSTVFHDLGNAVRRAAERAYPVFDDAVVEIPDSPVIAPAEPRLRLVIGGAEEAAPTKTRHRRRSLLVIAAALALALIATAAVAFTVPRTLHWFGTGRPPHTRIAPSPQRQGHDTPVASTGATAATDRPSRRGAETGASEAPLARDHQDATEPGNGVEDEDGNEQGHNQENQGPGGAGDDQGQDDQGQNEDGDDQGQDDQGQNEDGDDQGLDDQGQNEDGDDQGQDDQAQNEDGDDQGQDEQ